jgi:NodT family efflux transporter outer membrane factor (OMF) lipoprotein
MTGPLEWIRNGLKVGPNYCRPPAPIAGEWIEAGDPKVQGRPLRDGDWWNVFQDPQLNSLVDAAYEQNLTLRVLGTRVLEARAQQAITAGSIFPQTLQATGHYSRVGLSRNAANNPTALLPLLANLPGTGAITHREIPTNWYSDWTAGFNMSWELDFWGRFRRAIESANAALDSSVENYDDALVTLLADVATNYVQFRVAQQRIAIARDNVRTQERLVALAEKQLRVGTVDRLGVEQLRTVLEQTRSTIPFLEITRGQASDRLCVLLGIPPRDLEPKLGPGPGLGAEPMPVMPDWVAVGIPADLLRRRPDVRSAERRVAAQSALIGVAEADLYPTIFVDGTIGYEAQDLSKLFESRSFFGAITPNFKWNILNAGRIQNNVYFQEARTQELIATYQNQVLTAAQEVQTALRGFLRSQEQAADLARSVRAARAASDIGRSQYFQTGRTDLNRLFTLETTRVQQQDNLAVARGNIALNLISVYRALGGGWELRFQKDHGHPAPAAPGPAPEAAPEQLPAPQPAGVQQAALFARQPPSPSKVHTRARKAGGGILHPVAGAPGSCPDIRPACGSAPPPRVAGPGQGRPPICEESGLP